MERSLSLGAIWLGLALNCVFLPADAGGEDVSRSPVDVAVASNGLWVAAANERSDSISLVSTKTREVVDEFPVGDHPASIVFAGDSDRVVVTCRWSGTLEILQVSEGKLRLVRSVELGFHPCGLDVTKDGVLAYVVLSAANQVAEVDLTTGEVLRRLAVGSLSQYLTLSADETKIIVGSSGQSEIEVIDRATGKELYSEPLANGINLGHMLSSANSEYAYFTWMVYRSNPITVGNIKRGWVIASRIGRVRLDGPAYREAISLDVPELAVSDPLGILISGDGKYLVASAGGTHEILVYRLADLPFVGTGGPGDLIDRQLQYDKDRFFRVPLGGRPMGLAVSGKSQEIWVANYLRDSLQVVDLVSRKVEFEIPLGDIPKDSLVRRGMEIFYDGRRSLDQWYSCHSCHQNGGSNTRPMDTHNDGSEMTFKTVLPLQNVHLTKPWTWHGWQDDLDEAMHKSITSTMQGKRPTAKDKEALIAYLTALQLAPNPFRITKDGVSDQVQRGEALFRGGKAQCADCHSGPNFTDGEIHDVGTGSKSDKYDGYNTPSLRNLYQKTRWLHNGRAKTLERLLTELHSPQKVSGGEVLSDSEVADLIAYLKTL